ncbi:MAG TPA: hypothetical protein VFU15_11190, partial [Bacteroidia bacterium]|nr:hypothetical protein [Bacteroidia bacterium]
LAAAGFHYLSRSFFSLRMMKQNVFEASVTSRNGEERSFPGITSIEFYYIILPGYRGSRKVLCYVNFCDSSGNSRLTLKEEYGISSLSNETNPRPPGNFQLYVPGKKMADAVYYGPVREIEQAFFHFRRNERNEKSSEQVTAN